jgi:hypothetical protein
MARSGWHVPVGWVVGRISFYGTVGESELHKSCPLCGLLRRPDAAARRPDQGDLENGIIRAMLTKTAMTPFKRHQVGAPEIVQFAGLLILIVVICKHFGPGLHAHLTQPAITFLAIGLFLMIWPMSLKARQ